MSSDPVISAEVRCHCGGHSKCYVGVPICCASCGTVATLSRHGDRLRVLFKPTWDEWRQQHPETARAMLRFRG